MFSLGAFNVLVRFTFDRYHLGLFCPDGQHFLIVKNFCRDQPIGHGSAFASGFVRKRLGAGGFVIGTINIADFEIRRIVRHDTENYFTAIIP